jgi:hypothetical protein
MGAVIFETRKWYDGDGMLHRDDDLPAAVEDGYLEWYCHGKLHRDGDLAAVVYFDNKTKMWYKHGKLHRDGDLPATVYTDGSRAWFQHGRRHRNGDLPAVVHADGTQEWWVDGVQQTPADRAQTRRWSPLRAAFVGAVVARTRE